LIPRSKHFISVIRANPLMLYRKQLLLFKSVSQKHCEQNGELFSEHGG
jgi:hypothetical protein